MKQKKIEMVQVIRGMACIAIFLFHLPSEWGGVKANYSGFPLSIFFLLTGYFLLEGIRKTEHGYFQKKIFRIVPLYWIFTLLLFAVSLVFPGINHGRSYSLIDLAKSLLFIPYYNSDGMLFPILSVGWTLIIEVYDYIAFWIVYKILKRFKYREILTIVTISGMIILGTVLKLCVNNDPILDIWTSVYQLPFILGLVLSWLHLTLKGNNKCVTITWPSIIIGLMVIFYILCYLIPDNYAWIWACALVAASVFIFNEVRFPEWSIFLGNISYSVYLIHKFVIAVVEKIVAHLGVSSMTILGGIVLAFVMTILAASISYYFIESPVSKLRVLSGCEGKKQESS